MAPKPEESTSIAPSITPITGEAASKFQEILKTNGISNEVSSILPKDSGIQGENLGSCIEFVEVHFKDVNQPTLNLFVKRKHEVPEEAANGMMEMLRLFDKETEFFCNYLEEAKKFCKSIGQEDLLKIYPKCYYGDGKMLVFENLVLDKGYVLLDKFERQDFEAACMAVTNLAKHHALGHALINKMGGADNFFKSFPFLNHEGFIQEPTRQFLEASCENGIATNLSILEKTNLPGTEKASKRLNSLKGKPFQDIQASMETYPDTFFTLNHGDYWNNNMMWIKDKTAGKLLNQILIDFQVVRYNSPAVDLNYYLFSSVKQDVRRQKIREILQVYLKALRDTASDLGYPVSLTLDHLEKEICRHFQYGFWIGATLLSEAAMSTFKDIQEAWKKTNCSEDWGPLFCQLINQWIDNNPEKSVKIAKLIIGEMEEYDLLSRGRIC